MHVCSRIGPKGGDRGYPTGVGAGCVPPPTVSQDRTYGRGRDRLRLINPVRPVTHTTIQTIIRDDFDIHDFVPEHVFTIYHQSPIIMVAVRIIKS